MKSLDDARDGSKNRHGVKNLEKKAPQKCCFFLKFDVKYMGQYMGQLCYIVVEIWLICLV